jgi:stage II sporulation protein D
MKRSALFFIAALLLVVHPVFAQTPDEVESLEQLLLEEEHIRTRNENGDSHASGMRPELGPVMLGNPREAHTLIRVGISQSTGTTVATLNEFLTRHHTFAEISHTAGTVHMIDESTGKQIVAIDIPRTIMRFTRDSSGYQVTVDGVPAGTFNGPIFLKPTDALNEFRIEHILRSFSGIKTPSYRGAIQIAHGSGTPAQTLNVVNVVEIEDYVPGVVANESIASFDLEALKAQAVAARGYAISNIGRFRATFPYDIVDSSASQVYRGVISEHPRAVEARDDTAGLVGSYNGRIIEALYSSSFGGFSEDNEWIFNVPSNEWPGRNPVAYLRGIYDGDAAVAPSPSDELFWKTAAQPNVFDDCTRVFPPLVNGFSRWTFKLTSAMITARLTAGRFVLITGANTGTVTNVEVVSRMAGSGRIAIARITRTGGVVEVRGWDNLRNVLGRTPTSGTTRRACATPTLPPGTLPGTIVNNMVMNNPSAIEVNRDAFGNFVDVTIWGGGWGHNVGMSQYGAHGRARSGQDFLQILNAYYTGVDIGTYPIDVERGPDSGASPLRQVFYSPDSTGVLIVRNATFRKMRIHVNGTYDISLNEADLADGFASVDLSGFLVPDAVNTVQYNPVGHGSATVVVVVD